MSVSPERGARMVAANTPICKTESQIQRRKDSRTHTYSGTRLGRVEGYSKGAGDPKRPLCPLDTWGVAVYC